MTRIMRDSTKAADIPVAGTQLVAGYANGAFAWTPADYARFPGIPHVYIDVLGTDPEGAGVVDCEPLDVGISGAVRWTRDRLALKPDYPPIVYCNRSTLTPLFNGMEAAGLRVVRDFRLWIATLDGTETVPDMTGVTAIQAFGTAQTGGHYDESIVYDDSWHAPKPPSDPDPAIPGQTLHGLLVRPSRMTVTEVTSTDGRSWS